MRKQIIVNTSQNLVRVALLENGVLAELHLERSTDEAVAGNIYKGRVLRVLPGMQAAFVDIGLDKAAFPPLLDDAALIAAVNEETAGARALGLSKTPTLIVNRELAAWYRETDEAFDRIAPARAGLIVAERPKA